MELRYYFDILRRRTAFIGVVILAGLLAAYFITDRRPIYQAESLVYIGSSNLSFDPEDEDNVNVNQLATVDRLLITFSQMIMSRTVAELATAELGIDRSPEAVVGQTNAAPDGLTQMLRIQVRDFEPALARDLANALAQSFTENIRRFEGGGLDEDLDTGDLPSGLPAYVFELATIPQAPIGNQLVRNLMLGFAFSLLIACGVVFMLEYLDLTVKNAEDAERRIELPVLGVIPRFDGPYTPTLAPLPRYDPGVRVGG